MNVLGPVTRSNRNSSGHWSIEQLNDDVYEVFLVDLGVPVSQAVFGSHEVDFRLALVGLASQRHLSSPPKRRSCMASTRCRYFTLNTADSPLHTGFTWWHFRFPMLLAPKPLQGKWHLLRSRFWRRIICDGAGRRFPRFPLPWMLLEKGSTLGTKCRGGMSSERMPGLHLSTYWHQNTTVGNRKL